MKTALEVIACVVVGGLLIAIAWFGWSGIWEKFLFISLEPLQGSTQWLIGLTLGGIFVLALGGILLKVSRQ